MPARWPDGLRADCSESPAWLSLARDDPGEHARGQDAPVGARQACRGRRAGGDRPRRRAGRGDRRARPRGWPAGGRAAAWSDLDLGRLRRSHARDRGAVRHLRLLLDTHVVLWWSDEPELVRAEARTAIED